jgi:hypothetical protein
MSRGEKVRLPDVVAVKATERALLVRIEGKEHWIPQGQIDDESEVWREGDEGELVVSEWIATQKGLV